METLYIVSFLTALILILLSFLLGFVHAGGGHGGVHLDHGGHLGHGGVHLDHGGPHAGSSAGEHQGPATSPFNLNTLLGFALGFGGVGSLLASGMHWPGFLALLPAVAGGLGGGWLVWRMVEQLSRASRFLDPADFRMEGTLAKVTVTIRAGGTGEIMYTQGGSRHACGARGAGGEAVAKGEEVVILRYEMGIAYVQLLQAGDSAN